MARMQSTLLRRLVATDRRRDVSTVILWSLAITALYTQALIQKSSLADFDQALIFGVCVLAGAVMLDLGKALLGYVIAFSVAIGATFLLVTLPLSGGELSAGTNIVLYSLWISAVFQAVFPFPFLAYLIASILGAFLGEKYLS